MKVIAAKFTAGKTLIDASKLKTAVNSALDKVAKGTQSDYKETYRTWTRVRPDARITTPSDGQRLVSVADKIYRYVDWGTRPHMIRPKRAKFLFFSRSFRAKTTPNVIGSSAGSRGQRDTFAKSVKHPGIRARRFTEAIYSKRKYELQKEVNKAIGNL